jgi:formylglycine-generating enzyme required for sulfatase activity
MLKKILIILSACICLVSCPMLSYAEFMMPEHLKDIVSNEKWSELPGTIISPVDGSEMILIPAGEFKMGIRDNHSLASKSPDAVPEHSVYLNAFYIDKYEVSNEKFKKFQGATGAKSPLFMSDSKYNSLELPVVGIRYGDAVSYSVWAGKKIPTEAEWEKAARGTNGRIYPWGNIFSSSKTNSYESKIFFPVKTGKYPEGASFYGVMDMAGNVSEWVYDLYGSDYYKNSPYKNPKGPSGKGLARIIRGGDFKKDFTYVNCVTRFQAGAYSAFPNIGFRCSIAAADIRFLYNPKLADSTQEAVSSGVTVISSDDQKGTTRRDSTSDRRFYNPPSENSFKPVQYFRHLDFNGQKLVGTELLRKSDRFGEPYWKIYFESKGKIFQAQFYDQRDIFQFHVEPVYDSKKQEKSVKLFNRKGKLVYRSDRYFKNGKPVKGILYSSTGDYLGEEKF